MRSALPGYGTSFLMSFLSTVQGIVSSSEIYLIFGGVKEDGKIVRNYVLKLMLHLKYLESNEFTVNGKVINFEVEGFPNDIKMMAFLVGELNNASYYFSTFASGNSDHKQEFNKSFSMCGEVISITEIISDVCLMLLL